MEADSGKNPTVYTPYKPSPPCHSGNVRVLRVSNSEGGLYCGGWSRGADTEDFAVIDLTGAEPMDSENPIKAMNESAAQRFLKAIGLNQGNRTLPWLRFKIQDFGVPYVERETWIELSDSILEMMNEGIKVLVACQGGHGRTGMVASIICGIMNPSIDKPVEYLRSVYCDHAVETRKQHLYVHEMCGLGEPDELFYKGDVKTFSNYNWVSPYPGAKSETPPKEQDGPSGSVKLTDFSGSVHEENEVLRMMDELGIDYTVHPTSHGNIRIEVIILDEQQNETRFFDIYGFDIRTNSLTVVEQKTGVESIKPMATFVTTADINKFWGVDDTPWRDSRDGIHM